MRKTVFAPNEFYHIFGRGVLKNRIFHDERDLARFVLFLLYGQSSVPIFNVSRHVSNYVRRGNFGVSQEKLQAIISDRLVRVVAFTLMPNHFHILLQEAESGGISCFMHRLLVAHAKYYNERYQTVGHLFQGPFGAVHITDNRQLLHTSAYVHKNQEELREWKGRAAQYPWSSRFDYEMENRWGALLEQDIILGQFKDRQAYQHFIATSPAKEND